MAEISDLQPIEYQTIKFAEGSSITMERKQIRFGEIDGRKVAVKTWLQNGNGRLEDELKAYERLRTTTLKEFTPEPLGLVKNGMGKIIGLAVEARSGQLLSVYGEQKQKLLTTTMIDQLEEAVLAAYDNGLGVALDYKMLNEDNLGFDGKEGLWFCCCGLGQPDENYEATVRGQIDYLRKNFSRE